MQSSPYKRKLINARRVFVAGAHSFFRNAWLSVAATVVMTITLGSILLTSFASYTLNNTVQTFTAKIDVSIFFKTDANRVDIEKLSEDLRNNQSLGVKEVTYISKEQARASFEEANKDDIKTLQAIAQTKDAFPASIRVKTADTANLDKVVKVARDPKYSKIYDKDSYKDDAKRVAVDRLGNIAKFLRTGGLVASLVFGVISLLVIFNTIRMTIFNRKDEIEIMQLIGASKWYIRGPFLVEASIYGVIAAVLALSSFYIGVLGQAPKLGSYVEEIQPTVQQFKEWSLPIIGLTVIAGIIFGSFSAYLAIRKHLKLKHTK
jgi:cell division transport system permease protein